MFSINRIIKIFIFASLLSLLLWTIYWAIPSYEHFFNAINGISDSYIERLGLVYWASHLGLNARFLAAILVIISLFRFDSKGFFAKRKLVSTAIFFEALYFFLLIAFFWNLIYRDFILLAISYFFQAVIAVPFLVILAVKLIKVQNAIQQIYKWIGLAFAGYILALWANSTFRWFEMVWFEGLQLFFDGIKLLGFLNSIILMSLSSLFAIFAAILFVKKNVNLAIKWMGISLTTVGLHYVLYFIHSIYTNSLGFSLLVDLWTIPFLGLGIALIKNRNNIIRK